MLCRAPLLLTIPQSHFLALEIFGKLFLDLQNNQCNDPFVGNVISSFLSYDGYDLYYAGTYSGPFRVKVDSMSSSDVVLQRNFIDVPNKSFDIDMVFQTCPAQPSAAPSS